jgi:hypothetical protein
MQYPRQQFRYRFIVMRARPAWTRFIMQAGKPMRDKAPSAGGYQTFDLRQCQLVRIAVPLATVVVQTR